jgi:hypothetical protein
MLAAEDFHEPGRQRERRGLKPLGTAVGAKAGDQIMRASIRVCRYSPETEGAVA